MRVQMVTINESYVPTNQQQLIGLGTTKLFQIHTGNFQFVQQILFNVTSFVDHDVLLSPTPLLIQHAQKHFQINVRVCHFPGASMKGEGMDSSVT